MRANTFRERTSEAPSKVGDGEPNGIVTRFAAAGSWGRCACYR